MNDKNILACVDHSGFAVFVTDYASWASKKTGNQLNILHILDHKFENRVRHDHSGAIGLDAQQTLLDELSNNDESLSKLMREKGRLLLNNLKERALEKGCFPVEVKQRSGDLLETIKEKQMLTSLLVVGRRGSSAELTQRDLGRNIENIIKNVDLPVLAVSESFREPERIMVAFDGSLASRSIIKTLCDYKLTMGLKVHILMAGKRNIKAAKYLDWAKDTLIESGYTVTYAFIQGDAERIIAKEIIAKEIDLLVMGAYTNSPFVRFIIGSKTNELLRSLGIATLILK